MLLSFLQPYDAYNQLLTTLFAHHLLAALLLLLLVSRSVFAAARPYAHAVRQAALWCSIEAHAQRRRLPSYRNQAARDRPQAITNQQTGSNCWA
jgi:hypothetical protein